MNTNFIYTIYWNSSNATAHPIFALASFNLRIYVFAVYAKKQKAKTVQLALSAGWVFSDIAPLTVFGEEAFYHGYYDYYYSDSDDKNSAFFIGKGPLKLKNVFWDMLY